MRRSPFRDPFVIVASRNGAANDKEQNLRQRMRDTPSLPRILDDGKMVQQQPKARFLRQDVNGKAHGGGSESTPLHGIRIPATPKPPLTRVQSPGVNHGPIFKLTFLLYYWPIGGNRPAGC